MKVSVCPGTQYSDSLGTVVKSRRHYDEILRRSQDSERPLQHYEPVKKRERTEKPRRPVDPRAPKQKIILNFPMDASREVRERAAHEHAREYVKP